MRRYRLITARKERGWTQADVAQKLRITTGFYGMLEQGSRNPRLPLAFSLERLFGISVGQLFPDLFYMQNTPEDLKDKDQEMFTDAVNQ